MPLRATKEAPPLKSLHTKLKGQQTSVNNICKFVENYPEGTTASQIAVRLERLDALWEKISESVYEIETHKEYAASEAFSKECSDFENRYYDVKSFLLDKAKEFSDALALDQAARGMDSTLHGGMDHVRLPQIKLQNFDGNIDEWLSFRDLYTSLIHRKSDLSDVEKFHYLKGCLGGEAKALVDALKITRGNYTIAWETLQKRYDNSKLLKKRQVQTLFKLPNLGRESVVDLQGLLEGFERSIQTLDQVVQPADYKDLLLIEVLSARLDTSTRRGWEEFSSTKEQDTLTDLIEFIQRRIRILESLPIRSSDSRQESLPVPAKRKPFVRVTNNAVQSTSVKCPACTENHLLHLCPAFLQMAVPSRESLIRTHALCRNCLKRGHQARNCSSKYTCRKCKAQHHTLVCFKGEADTKPQAMPNGNNGGSSSASLSAGTNQQESNAATTSSASANMAHGRTASILLATAVVLVEDDTGSRYPARAMLDSGSECNFMTESLSQRLKIHNREKVDVSVLGIGHAATKAKQRIQVSIKSRVSLFGRSLSFLVLPKVTVNLPTTSVQTTGWEFPEGIELADPSFFKASTVDLVLGIQSFFSFFKTGQEISLGDGLPGLTETVFGWVVSGEVRETPSQTRAVCNMALSDTLEKLMERFWACEEVGLTNNYSPEEARCEEQYARTVEREASGRYNVTMPKDEEILAQLGESKDIAFRRLQGLERRLSRDEDLSKKYKACMAEYLQLGHMRKAEDDARNGSKRCYLPHHPVVKEASTTTKVRVVFDASCKTSSGISLNNTLLVGPVIQRDLRTIVLRSRTRQVMVVADAEKMYQQINMNQLDIPLQSTLWRFTTEDEVETYELTTVTYGTRPAPFLATRTLKQLAVDERERYPLAAQAVDEDIYMDDVISGADDIETAVELQKQCNAMMASGGFKLRKWASNFPAALEGIPRENLALPTSEEVNWDQDQAVRTLGLTWIPKTDCFKYHFQIPTFKPEEILTKRKVLSAIAMLFDPLGLLGATITWAKIFMQHLWNLRDERGGRLDWDVPLPRTVGEEWRIFHDQVGCLTELRVPRCVIVSKPKTIEIHCFSDASEKAYGACVYIRSVDDQGEVSVHLFTAKSKVAPLKVQSLPRLELCGALLAAELFEKVSEAIKGSFDVFFWTDSTCVLRWISATPNAWTTFVANRVAKIQRITENHTWRHVPGVSNPADLISRGIQPNAILENHLWWEGPSWLKDEQIGWPQQCEVHLEEIPEKRGGTTVCVGTLDLPFSVWFISKFSSYTRMLRSTAYWLRLIALLRHTRSDGHGFLTSTELKQAESVIVRRVQEESFSKDIAALSKTSSVHNGSALRWFKPVMTEEGVLRVGGRLGQSEEAYDTKHPMILPAKHLLTELIMKHYHETLLHAGPQLLLGTVRLRFWPLGGRSIARKVVHKCQRCFRAKPTILQQQMGELPTARVTVARPFSRTGVDYFGPVYIRDGRRRAAIKAYVAVFVCMGTKAVHMELVTDLSTDRFLQALRRFIARRGRCSDIYSDNGTNFVGARNQMKELFLLLKDHGHQEAISKECTNQGIHWHFNPPAAPHFGGLWEAAVRSAKFHLLRVLGGTPASYEDFTTLLTQVEACLNSRPLTPLSDEPTDLEPLTPAHFLTGGSLQALPEPDYSTVKLNRLNRWQMVQRQLQDFWRRWRSEYLSQLQGRMKNWKPAIRMDVGRLVIIVDPNLPPIKWKLGRIHQLHPEPDGIARVATVKTATGFLTRPLVKLCLLPTQEDGSPTTGNSSD